MTWLCKNKHLVNSDYSECPFCKKDIKFRLAPKGRFDMRAVAGNVVRKR